jgi:DNA-binding GntR family transcriptional regulator
MSAGASGRERPVPRQPPPPPAEAAIPDGSGASVDRGPLRATTVLADRMAAALVHREPGWRLPRRTALARRYNVSLTEIDTALGDLARRSLVRRLPDGQLYRASPADYWIPVEGAAGLGTRLDPMGGAITCQTRHVSRREAPQDVAWALRLPSGAPIRVVRCVWVSAGDPAAVSTAYLNEPPGDEDAEPGQEQDEPVPSLGSVLNALPAAAVSVEMSPPQPSVARSLRLSPGQPVITVTVRFDDTATGEPAGLTVVMLRPELFRVAIDTTEAPAGTPLAAASCPRPGCRSRGCPRRGAPAWTYVRRTWDAGTRDAGRGRDRGGIDATACPIPRPQGTAPP